MGTAQKQKQIRTMLDALGWSHKQLADVLYEELQCSEFEDLENASPEEIRKFREALKKHLQRDSTPESRLEQYVKVISEHPDFVALGLDVVVPKYVNHRCLDEDSLAGLAEISSWLDDREQVD
ncbi:elongation factor Ts [Vibrio parahaemolyticus]|uniref:translation elongation factor Ts n=1 Tax=Vibrio harveyi group TaxID=717610 RepID=UPI000429211E|nr:translation elongation factor Ts [Vibrio parahaemolyticus]EGQ8244427.1 elongation factor Ts [Vibrio parahaemolyticus]EGQ8387694.1 elongation factor Ts [Vibrio parahaemolyticus]EGQ8954866.1 elongation factor Ts [Vibrio parahaemolyticus]EGQ8989174.1 elongation factor Ts [Vibrio parahaemolyticus]EGQ9008431.1 elongation factor Ts [Vibrio parahaemolyticus]